MKKSDGFHSNRQSLLVPACFTTVRECVRSGNLAAERRPALERLLREAEEVLTQEPVSLLDKKHVPPSGDKRDYFSLSIYFWPNTETDTGLPYVPRDGEVNPEVSDYDRPNFTGMFYAVDTLTLAYALAGEERFAAKAIDWLRTWFVAEHTRMNPNMLFAQHIPGDDVVLPWKEYPARFVPGSEGRKGVYVSFGGVIEDLELAPLTDCIRILRESSHWTADDDGSVLAWYRDYTEWLLTHQHGLDEAACRNNHGSWYWSEVICFLNFTGQGEKAGTLVERMLPERLKLQFAPDGSQPEELVRTLSMGYSAFTLCSFTNLAVAARACGRDPWAVQTEDGRSIRTGLDWMLPYLTGKKEWTWKQIKPFPYESMPGLLAAAAAGTGDPKYQRAIAHLPGVAPDERSLLLFDPVPDPGTSVNSVSRN